MTDSPGGRPYKPLFELSRGGMARVWVVLQEEGDWSRLFAEKRLHPHLAEDPDIRAMFLAEARIAGHLRHAHVVSVVGSGEDAEGPYLLMDLIDGISAAELLTKARTDRESLPVQLCIRIAGDVARGLHAAHELRNEDGTLAGLVHRDVSPQNVLIGFDGITRLTDFGVAKLPGAGTRTATGLLKGKVGYMAPECLRFRKPDRRADLFSLGVVLYELLTAQRLYDARDEGDAARRILDEPPPDVGMHRDDLPAPLIELVFQLLAKEVDDRPATAAEVATRLDAIGAALARDEGPFDVAEFLTGWFGPQRAERERRISEARAALATRPPPGPTARPSRRILGAALGGAGLIVVGAAVLGRRRLAGPSYPAGFVWRRSEDWDRATAGGQTPANPMPDASGAPVWHYEVFEGGGGLDEPDPWYLRPSRPMRWDDRFLGEAGYETWARGDDTSPNVGRTFLAHGLGPADRAYTPAVRWRNPTAGPVHVDVSAALSGLWDPDGEAFDVVLFRDGSPGQPVVLARGRLVPAGPTDLPVRLTGVPLGVGQALSLSVRGHGTRGHVTLLDKMAVTLVPGFARR